MTIWATEVFLAAPFHTWRWSRFQSLAAPCYRFHPSRCQRAWGEHSVFVEQRALIQNHVGKKGDAVGFALVDDAGLLRGPAQHAVVVLHRRKYEAFFRQGVIDQLDFLQVMVGPHAFDLAAFEQGYEMVLCIYADGVVHQVEVDVVRAQPLATLLQHLRYRTDRCHFNDLRREFGGELQLLARVLPDEFAQHSLGRIHAINGGRVSQGETGLHGGIKHRFETGGVQVWLQTLNCRRQSRYPRTRCLMRCGGDVL